MKKAFLLTIGLLGLSSLMMAQTGSVVAINGTAPGALTITGTPTTSTAGYTAGSGLTGYDVLGAHQNGGRGCAGCHAPHSGGQGGGGNAGSGAFSDPYSGDNALFGQDLSPLYGVTVNFGDTSGGVAGYVWNTPSAAAAYSTNTAELRGIMMCLACHDGNVAKGAMMNGTSWEQRLGLLPVGVYGNRPIPTLLGADNPFATSQLSTSYLNDHPVGPNAKLSRAMGSALGAGGLNLSVSASGRISLTGISGAYATFVSNYGFPAIAGSTWSMGVSAPNGDTNAADVFITCTTCHDQHSMYSYTDTTTVQTTANAKIKGGTYPTYFFINAPYNPGTGNLDPTKAASTTQFCRQCHFGESNEANGVTNVQTAF